MDTFEKHEQLEMEVLRELANNKLLNDLVFGGGTMLRLCYGLNRYSVDLDFFAIREFDQKKKFANLADCLSRKYEITDMNDKLNTMLYEVKDSSYPRKLKIEIRKEVRDYDYQQRIAFSKFSTIQVILNVLTLEQALKNKVAAALDRKIIRDFFDIEFLLKQGAELACSKDEIAALKKVMNGFSQRDYKVILGSILEKEQRDFYMRNGFPLLTAQLNRAHQIGPSLRVVGTTTILSDNENTSRRK